MQIPSLVDLTAHMELDSSGDRHYGCHYEPSDVDVAFYQIKLTLNLKGLIVHVSHDVVNLSFLDPNP